MRYDFQVVDSEGLWGQVTVDAASEEEARRKARRELEEDVTYGSLLPDYRLDLDLPLTRNV